MHQANFGVISTSINQIVKNWDNDFEHIAAFQHMEHELAVVLAKLPEKNKELLVEVNLKIILFSDSVYFSI